MKLVLWGAGVVLLLIIALAVLMRMVPNDVSTWHVDPTAIERTGNPNDYFVASPELAMADADEDGPTSDLPPTELLFLFDAIASNAPRVRVLGGSVQEGMITYVQRSALLGFPDYISVKSVTTAEGKSSLVIWSRSRYGYSDMGVNADRVRDWLSKMQSSG